VRVVTIQLLKPKKLYTGIWKNDAMCTPDAELEVVPGNAEPATGSNPPQVLTKEMEEEHFLILLTSRLWGVKAGSRRINKATRQ